MSQRIQDARRVPWTGRVCFLLAMTAIAMTWWTYGTRFVDNAIPFYDSLGYQEGYRATALATQRSGPWVSLVATWQEPANNVVLYKFFAALFGKILPSSREGLFVYLFSIHLSAVVALFFVVRRWVGADGPALLAVAVVWALPPFGMMRDGVGDQRMDLASGSFYLCFASLGLLWLLRPSAKTALLTGLCAALAALHRPVMVPSIAVLAVLLLVIATFKNPQSRRAWILQSIAALAPVMLLDVPWFLHHFEDLRFYYFEFNYDVGNATSLADSIRFNLNAYGRSFGWIAATILGAGLILYSVAGARIRWGRASLVALITLIPLTVLVVSKSAANLFVQQICLCTPALLLGSLQVSDSKRIGLKVAGITLAAVVLTMPFRLAYHHRSERPMARAEVENAARQVSAVNPSGRVASFHDLPANGPAIIAVAHQLAISLESGINAYHPVSFGLSNEYREDVTSDAVRTQVVATLARVKSSDQLLILPTADTTFRLWQGLYSHRLMPLIRQEVERDPAFVRVARAGPIQEVYFDVYRVR